MTLTATKFYQKVAGIFLGAANIKNK